MAKKKRKKDQPLLIAITIIAAVCLLLTAALVAAMGIGGSEEEPSQTQPQRPLPPKNEYDPEAFYTDGEFLRYREQAHMVGVDVSVYQGVVDWEQVAQSGVEFAIVRLGYRGSSLGKLYEDETFQDNLEAAQAAGLKVGAYFFSQAANAEEAREEGEYACALLDGMELDLPVYYDWEMVEGSSRIEGPGSIPMTECAVAFCQAVEREGYEAGVYFNQSYGYYYLDLGALQDYSLWLAEYNPVPGFEYHFHCLQYSDKGTVPGIETPVDLNLMFLE